MYKTDCIYFKDTEKNRQDRARLFEQKGHRRKGFIFVKKLHTMKPYLGTKIVRACPMDNQSFYRQYRPDQQTPQPFQDGYKVIYEDGYTSWSPKDSFDHAYREISAKELELLSADIPATQRRSGL
jgi:hypothetical protein